MSASDTIKAEEIPLADLFGPKFMFSIPIYQRPFSWTIENFDLLFEDIAGSYDNSSGQQQYFLGSLLLQGFGENSYFLVDGQQRMTSIAILLAAIRDKTANTVLRDRIESYLYQQKDEFKNIPERMRITPWEELKELFREYIYQVDGTKRFLADFGSKIMFADQEDPKYHMYEAIQSFYKKIEGRTDIEAMVKYILNKVYLVYIRTSSQTSAFRLFSVMNARGLPLDPSDLLKSESLEAISDPPTRDKYAKVWRNIEEDIGREELGNLIAYVRTIKTKAKAELGLYDEFQKIFREKTIVRGAPFIDYLNEVNGIYRKRVLEGEIDVKDSRKNNDYKVTVKMMLGFIPFSDWVPALLAFLHKFGQSPDAASFLNGIEKKVVIEWAIGKSPTERITSLNKLIQLIDDSKDSQDVLKNFPFPSPEDAEKPFVDMMNNSGIYWTYGGKLARYILLRLDKEKWEIENFTGYPGSVTVEHILPQNPEPTSVWYSAFGETDRNKWTNALGNLTLLSGRKNSQAQNYDFSKKKSVYFSKKGATGFKITQQLDNQRDWTMVDLKNRHDQFMDELKTIYWS